MFSFKHTLRPNYLPPPSCLKKHELGKETEQGTASFWGFQLSVPSHKVIKGTTSLHRLHAKAKTGCIVYSTIRKTENIRQRNHINNFWDEVESHFYSVQSL